MVTRLQHITATAAVMVVSASLSANASPLAPVVDAVADGQRGNGQSAGNTYYVSPSGDDATGTGTLTNPWQTVQKAASAMQPGDTTILREGTYRETVTPAHSGTAAAPITFRAYEGETVTVSGTDVVTGWTVDSGNVYRADIELDLGHENQVFDEGHMLIEARWPNTGGTGTNQLLEFNTATMDAGTTPTAIVDAALPDYDWTGGQVWVSSNKRWYDWTGHVTGYDSGSLDIVDNSDDGGNHVAQAGGKYYVSGIRDALDTAGEWFYDEQATALYVWTRDGNEPSNNIEVKTRKNAFDLSGKEHINLQGINIHAASLQFDGLSRAVTMDGLTINYAYHSDNAEVPYRSQIDTGVVLNGTGHTLKNSEIAYNSGSGVKLNGENHRVVNNYIHDNDYIGSYAASLMLNTKNSIISHNTLSRSGRSAVGKTGDDIGLYGSLFQYNDLSQGGYLTDDLGLLYMNLVDGGNSEIRHNWFHNSSGRGIYFDHGAKNFIIHHNVVWDVSSTPIHNNLYSNYMLWYNNTTTPPAGSSGMAGNWEAAMARDRHGSQLVNNVTTDVIDMSGANLTVLNNSTCYAQLVDNRYLSPDTSPIDSAIHLAGINDDFNGSGPDKGAYEFGAAQWTPGHDFDNPPSPVDTSRSEPEYRNLVENASFAEGTFAPWQTVGDDVSLTYGDFNQWDNDKTVLGRGYSANLGGGANEIYQTIDGLEPNTTYELMAKLRVDAGETAHIGVRDVADGQQTGSTVTHTESLWQKEALMFSTGPSDTSATIFVNKDSTGSGNVFVEDVGLQLTRSIGTATPAFADDFEERAACAWGAESGSWSVESIGDDRVYEQSVIDATNSQYSSAGDTGWSDYVVEAELQPVEFHPDGGNVQLGFRFQSLSNRYFVQLRSAGDVQLKKQIDDAQTVLANAPYPVEAGETYTVRVEAIGSQIDVYVDDTHQLSVTDSSLPTGKVSLETWRASARFDDVSVTSATE